MLRFNKETHKMKKTFILGVGAQKAGTTWLHGQLSKNEAIDFGFRKEYHVFDIVEALEKSEHGKRPIGRYEAIIDAIAKHSEDPELIECPTVKSPLRNALLELAFIKNTNTYFNYFNQLAGSGADLKAVGDITPAYALLSQQSLQSIKQSLEARDFSIKVIFLMRDPIERIWSSARMKKRELSSSASETFNEFKFLNKLPQSHRFIQKSVYQKTVRNLEAVFRPDQIHYGFYETLFDASFKTDLQQFLGFPLQAFDSSQVFNASPKSTVMPLALKQKLAETFSDTYTFCADRFGAQVTDVWSGYSSRSIQLGH